RERHLLHRHFVIPLPVWRADPQTHSDALFPVGAPVLALHSQSSRFFTGTIVQQPQTVSDTYTVQFDKPVTTTAQEPPCCQVHQRYVTSAAGIAGLAHRRATGKRSFPLS